MHKKRTFGGGLIAKLVEGYIDDTCSYTVTYRHHQPPPIPSMCEGVQPVSIRETKCNPVNPLLLMIAVVMSCYIFVAILIH